MLHFCRNRANPAVTLLHVVHLTLGDRERLSFALPVGRAAPLRHTHRCTHHESRSYFTCNHVCTINVWRKACSILLTSSRLCDMNEDDTEVMKGRSCTCIAKLAIHANLSRGSRDPLLGRQADGLGVIELLLRHGLQHGVHVLQLGDFRLRDRRAKSQSAGRDAHIGSKIRSTDELTPGIYIVQPLSASLSVSFHGRMVHFSFLIMDSSITANFSSDESKAFSDCDY